MNLIVLAEDLPAPAEAGPVLPSVTSLPSGHRDIFRPARLRSRPGRSGARLTSRPTARRLTLLAATAPTPVP